MTARKANGPPPLLGLSVWKVWLTGPGRWATKDDWDDEGPAIGGLQGHQFPGSESASMAFTKEEHARDALGEMSACFARVGMRPPGAELVTFSYLMPDGSGASLYELANTPRHRRATPRWVEVRRETFF